MSTFSGEVPASGALMEWTPLVTRGAVCHALRGVTTLNARREEETPMPRTATIAVDLAKSVFEVAVSTQPGRVSARHRLTRPQFARFVATTPPATVVMEACGTAHYWGRQAQAHTTRTARLNTVRGLLREFGVAIPVGARQVRPAVIALLADPDSPLPTTVRPALQSVLDELTGLEERLRTVEQQLTALAAALPAVATLRTIPGVGLLTATALVGFVGDAHRFPTARHFASDLGLTPPRTLQRRPPPPRRHQQTRRCLPAHAPHPRRSLRALPRQAPGGTAAPPHPVGARPRPTPRPQPRRHRACDSAWKIVPLSGGIGVQN